MSRKPTFRMYGFSVDQPESEALLLNEGGMSVFVHLLAETIGIPLISSFINSFPEPYYVPGVVLRLDFPRRSSFLHMVQKLGGPNTIFIGLTFRVQETRGFLK